ncbi:MAG: hypothetical protein ACD_43C00161G0002 [uncultured bacterium]|nr:MAG: hypothetical protein ACD_43C00161G0002 [uncultured bacterium]
MKQWWIKHGKSVGGLLMVYVLTTVPFLTRYPYNWDAAQFELSLQHFSIHMHQPHPPGYLLFVAVAKVLSFGLGNHWAVVAESALFGAIAVVLLYVLTTEFWPEKRWVRLIITLGFILNPLFWLYRETGLTYTVDAAAVLALAWLCLGTLRYRQHKYFIASCIVLPVACGLRPSLLILLGPLWLLAAWHHKRNWKFVLIWSGVCLGLALAWVIPLIILSGGIGAYWTDSTKLYRTVTQATSLFAGAPLLNVWQQIKLMISTLVYSWNSVWVGLVMALILGTLHMRSRQNWLASWQQNRTMLLWVLAWVVPAFIVYGFIHLGQLGYLVFLIPLGYLGIGSVLVWLEQRFTLWQLVVGLGLAAHAVIFLWVKPGYGHPEYRPVTVEQRWLQTAARLAPNLFKLNRFVLAEHDETVAAYETMLATADPATTVIITVRDVMYPAAANNLAVRNSELFRELSVLGPDFQVIELAPQRNYFLTATSAAMATTYDNTVLVPDSTHTIIVAAHMLPDSVMPTNLILGREQLPNVTSRYYRGIMDKPWTFLGYTIERPADL